MATIKKCKGQGKAKSYGCGVELPYSENNGLKTYKAKYGLGLDCKCYYTWLYSSEEGSKIVSSLALKAKKEVAEKSKKEDSERMQKMKIDSMSPDKYRAKYVQPLINKIARYIDHGNPCTPTGNYEGKMAGGHYTSVGANRTICLNLHNIFIQSFASNSWKGGDDKKYRAALERIFGLKYLEFVEGLNSHRSIQLRKPQLIEIKEKAEKIALHLKKNLQVLSSEQRIEVRNTINVELGIYDEGYCQFIK
ncbi:NinG/ Rap DNA junction specific endonuclease [Tenacibaculum phage Gundel_1]|uniref:Protein ninG n=1 Tax=Tenacibaculum phage Gundel_1 TaxID=2745672 RepID=A0A8E4ZFX3_9CAUD|nr:NinG/ Rap DNA junction specific endonuclease [Tenacibaculum phage Gundel_1]QQV91425.1 recombination protein [Tenacibaculum phage Gundel_1]